MLRYVLAALIGIAVSATSGDALTVAIVGSVCVSAVMLLHKRLIGSRSLLLILSGIAFVSADVLIVNGITAISGALALVALTSFITAL